MTFGLSDSLLQQFKTVFSRFPEIDEVIIYGSRAKGNYREGSDIDISLKGKGLNEKTRAQVWLDLDELNSPFLIDLSVYELLNSKSLQEHIDRVGQILYSKI